MTKISALTAGTSPTGTEKIPAVQSGSTVSLTVAQIQGLAASGSFTSLAYTTTLTGTSTSANALTVGRQGATTPVLAVDASTASQVTGIKVTGAASASGVALQVTSSGTNEPFFLNGKGNSTCFIQNTGTGQLALGNGLGGVAISSALTYGGVTLSNAVTGTGNMVLSASPTFTGTLTAATLSATTYNGNTLTAGTFTLTGAASKTLAFNNTITLGGTDGTTMTFPTTTATIARTDASQTFSGTQTFAAGSAATPGVTVGTAGYGIYQPGANQLGISVNTGVLLDYGITTSGTFTAGANFVGLGKIVSSFVTGGVGYATGAGLAVSQGTNRTTGVTINAVCGAITMFSQVNSAVSGATAQTFTVTNSAVAATDTIIVNQKSGTDLYLTFVTNVAAGSFKITNYTTGGTTNEAPVFNFAVLKAVAA